MEHRLRLFPPRSLPRNLRQPRRQANPLNHRHLALLYPQQQVLAMVEATVQAPAQVHHLSPLPVRVRQVASMPRVRRLLPNLKADMARQVHRPQLNLREDTAVQSQPAVSATLLHSPAVP